MNLNIGPETPKSDIQREIEAHAERPGWTPEAKALLDAAALHQRIGELERELSRVTEERDAAIHRAEKLAATLELERNSAESVHRVLRGALDIGPEGNVMTAIEHLKTERAARLKMHDEMERQAQLATEARMDRDAALRRVEEAWELIREMAVSLKHEESCGSLNDECCPCTCGIGDMMARLDAAEKGERS